MNRRHAVLGIERLTNEQRKLVEDNVGLVGVHLRRYFPGSNVPRRDREWDDLFQEGCLGLALAASRYDTRSGMPFAAYAFQRIRLAVGRAATRAFSTVRAPEGAKAGSVVTVSLEGDPSARPAAGRHERSAMPSGETVGERIRKKLEHAVREAAGALEDYTDEGRAALVTRLAEDRMLIPEEAYRAQLRGIAREHKTTYSRVTWIEGCLTQLVRERLSADPEIGALRDEARRHPDGMDAAFCGEVKRNVSVQLDAQLTLMIGAWPAHRRESVTMRLMNHCGVPMDRLLTTLLRRLSIEQKRALLAENEWDPATPRTTPLPNPAAARRRSCPLRATGS